MVRINKLRDRVILKIGADDTRVHFTALDINLKTTKIKIREQLCVVIVIGRSITHVTTAGPGVQLECQCQGHRRRMNQGSGGSLAVIRWRRAQRTGNDQDRLPHGVSHCAFGTGLSMTLTPS